MYPAANTLNTLHNSSAACRFHPYPCILGHDHILTLLPSSLCREQISCIPANSASPTIDNRHCCRNLPRAHSEMSPASTFAAVSQLKQLIYYHLDNESLDNANFLAARLYAIDSRNPDTSHLLALTYQRLRRPKAAYDFAQKHGATGKHLGCAFVFALACHSLGNFSEGINALEKARHLWLDRCHWGQYKFNPRSFYLTTDIVLHLAKHTETSRRHLPDAAAVNALLGRLWRGHGDSRRAGDCYVEAHKTNPFIWEAFQALCDMGAFRSFDFLFFSY